MQLFAEEVRRGRESACFLAEEVPRKCHYVYIFGEQPRLLEEQLHLHGVESPIFADQLCFHGTLTHLHGEEVALVGHRTKRTAFIHQIITVITVYYSGAYLPMVLSSKTNSASKGFCETFAFLNRIMLGLGLGLIFDGLRTLV